MNKLIYLLFFSFLVLTSCGHNQAELEKVSRHRADSLFQMRIPAMEARLDSLCSQKMAYALQYKLDSLVLQRKNEILKLQEGL